MRYGIYDGLRKPRLKLENQYDRLRYKGFTFSS